MGEQQNTGYYLKRIKVLDFRLNYHLKAEKEDHTVNYDIESQLDVNEELSLIAATLKLDFKLKEEDVEEEQFGFIVTRCFFEIDPLEDVLIIKDKEEGNVEKQINTDFAIMLASLSFSTTRGILHEKSYGSILEDHPLPVINPKILINTDQDKRTKKGNTN